MSVPTNPLLWCSVEYNRQDHSGHLSRDYGCLYSSRGPRHGKAAASNLDGPTRLALVQRRLQSSLVAEMDKPLT